MLTSFADLKALLEARKLPMLAHDDSQAVEIPTHIRNEAHTAVILWDPRATLLQVIQPLTLAVLPAQEGEVCEALVRINHQLVLPGFGYDYGSHRIYFRWVLPRNPDGTLTEDSLDRALRTVLETCRDFLPGLRALLAGQIPASEVGPFSARLAEEDRSARGSA